MTFRPEFAFVNWGRGREPPRAPILYYFQLRHSEIRLDETWAHWSSHPPPPLPEQPVFRSARAHTWRWPCRPPPTPAGLGRWMSWRLWRFKAFSKHLPTLRDDPETFEPAREGGALLDVGVLLQGPHDLSHLSRARLQLPGGSDGAAARLPDREQEGKARAARDGAGPACAPGGAPVRNRVPRAAESVSVVTSDNVLMSADPGVWVAGTEDVQPSRSGLDRRSSFTTLGHTCHDLQMLLFAFGDHKALLRLIR